MRSVFALGVAAFAGFCAAQDSTQNDYPYTIDPNSVSDSDRQYWCDQNKAQCPLICLQQPGVTSMTTTDNDCDPDTLTYSCVCENGVSPNITQYSQTLPFFICQEWGNQCVSNCNGVNTCANDCRANHPCGAQSPYLGNSSLLSTMSSTAAPTGSATNKIPVTGFGGATATSTPDTGAAPASFMPSAGLSVAAVFSSIFLGFAVLL
ncbi:Nn.00g058740.m01.CDS01 [Neocucurbitaria sp. VM-36]